MNMQGLLGGMAILAIGHSHAPLASSSNLFQVCWIYGTSIIEPICLIFLVGYLIWNRNFGVMERPRRKQEDFVSQEGPFVEKKGVQLAGLLHAGLQQLPCPIIIIESKTARLVFANQASFHLFGVNWIPNDQLTSRHLDEIFTIFADEEAAKPIGEELLLRVRESGRTEKFESLFAYPSGSGRKNVAITAVPLYEHTDSSSFIVAYIDDETDGVAKISKIQEIAYCDSLTGLANRHSILQHIQAVIEREGEKRFAILFMDFDRFKLINDSLGHEVGDQLLKGIADRIRGMIRSEDFVGFPARLGGDEFVVLLDQLNDVKDASAIAERLLSVLGEPYSLAGRSVVSTASIGVAISGPEVKSAADMLRNADLAMYKAKATGKARCSYFDDGLKREVEQRLQLETELRAALTLSEFDVAFQPIVDFESGCVSGYEALLRWSHPRLGRISAGQFFDVANETGLIVPIGDFALTTACSIAGESQFASRGLRLHVNISRLQVLLPSLMDILGNAVDAAGLDASSLVLEVSESSLSSEPERVISRLHELKARGHRLCLDNFGSGAAPLTLVRELPIDFLKLDRSLVASVSSSPENLVLLQSLVTIAASHDIRVIAEGIEASNQIEQLREIGCHFGQGYFFQRPLEASGLDDLSNCVVPCSATSAARRGTATQ